MDTTNLTVENIELKTRAQDLSSVNTSKLPDDLIIKLDKNLITEWELKQQLSMSISIPIASDQLRDQDSSSVTAEIPGEKNGSGDTASIFGRNVTIFPNRAIVYITKLDNG
ncbi:17077_t:CDS:2, partial [Entrophospora sp. SA101]